MSENRGYSEETCIRCGWRMGNPPLNCQNDNTPHVFPSSAEALEPKWHGCGYCFAVSWGVGPVHGDGVPCPMKVAESTAQVELLEAQTAVALSQGMIATDMSEKMITQIEQLMTRMFGEGGTE